MKAGGGLYPRLQSGRCWEKLGVMPHEISETTAI